MGVNKRHGLAGPVAREGAWACRDHARSQFRRIGGCIV
jgi:hypothetical protein